MIRLLTYCFIFLLTSSLMMACNRSQAITVRHIDSTITINQNFFYGYKFELPLPEDFSYNNSSNLVVNPFFHSFEIVGIDTGWGMVHFWKGADTFYKIRVRVMRSPSFDSLTRMTQIINTDTTLPYLVSTHREYCILNRPLPPFNLSLPSGSKSRLVSGKVGLLNIWNLNSGIGPEKNAAITEIKRKHPDDFEIYSLYGDSSLTRLEGGHYTLNLETGIIQHSGLQKTVVPVTTIPFKVPENFYVNALPRTFIIDRTGTVRHIVQAYRLDETSEQALIDKIRFVMHYQ